MKPHLKDPNFEPEVVAKSSKAAMGLCKWVRAMMQYYDVSLVVAPKRKQLEFAEQQTRETLQQLQDKKVALEAVMAKLQELTEKYSTVVREKEHLELEYNDCLRRSSIVGWPRSVALRVRGSLKLRLRRREEGRSEVSDSKGKREK